MQESSRYVSSLGFRSLDGIYHGFCYDTFYVNVEWHVHPLDPMLVPPGFTIFGGPKIINEIFEPTFLNDLFLRRHTREVIYYSIQNFLRHNLFFPIILFSIKKQDYVARRVLVFREIDYVVKYFDSNLFLKQFKTKSFGAKFAVYSDYSFSYSFSFSINELFCTKFTLCSVSYFLSTLFIDIFNPSFFFSVEFKSGCSYFFNYNSTHHFKVYRASTTDWRTFQVILNYPLLDPIQVLLFSWFKFSKVIRFLNKIILINIHPGIYGLLFFNSYNNTYFFYLGNHSLFPFLFFCYKRI